MTIKVPFDNGLIIYFLVLNISTGILRRFFPCVAKENNNPHPHKRFVPHNNLTPESSIFLGIAAVLISHGCQGTPVGEVQMRYSSFNGLVYRAVT